MNNAFMAFHTKQPDSSVDQEQAFLPRLGDEDWAAVERLLPDQWQAKARELHALRRTRGVADAATLLRVMLIHIAQGLPRSAMWLF